MKVVARATGLLIVLVGLTLGACSREAIVLWTDTASTTQIVEEFNAAQSDFVVDLHYREDLSLSLRLEEKTPDLVIASYVEDLSTSRLFAPLDRMMGTRVDPGMFYGGLLESGQRGGKQLLLPVSFDLPLIYFTGASPVDDAELVVTPERLRSHGEQFAEGDEDRWTRVAFSPRWDSAYLYEHLRLSGFSVRERSDGTPEWSEETLAAGLDDVRDWIETVNGGIEWDLEFQERYLYDPFPQLIRRGRIRFAYDTAAHYFQQSDSYRTQLSFLWLGERGRIDATESVTYVAITNRAWNRKGAEALVSWLFDEQRQVDLLSSAARKRLTSFGIVGGFSSLVRVNDRHLATVYPELSGRVPPSDWIRFPSPSPRHWAALQESVVQPWLLREAAGVQQSRTLADSVRAWLLQQEE